MDKAEILAVIKQNILENLDDVSEDQIDVSRSMKDYGANSLDIIEIVSCSIRQLEIKVPRAELTDIKNIDQLADKLLQYVPKQE